MVKETRIIFDPMDILHVRLICCKCGGEMVHRRNKQSFKQSEQRCPSCKEPWWDPSDLQGTPRTREMVRLLESLHALANAQNDDEPKFRMVLEIDGEPKA